MISAVSGSVNFAPSSSNAPATTMAAGGDFNTFLKMLTAQLKNQDPLNPMEGTEFAVQLATFSGVEQQAQTNKLLGQLVGQMGGGLGQVATWIGKEAQTTAPVWFGQSPLTLDINPDPTAENVTLVTLNAAGNEVSREEIGPGSGQIEWMGRDALGKKLADGLYSFVIESSRRGQVIGESQVQAYARITEAKFGPDGIELGFEGGGTAPASSITALRDPN